MEYLSKTVLSGARPYELEILKRFMKQKVISMDEMIGAFEKLDNSNDISAVAKCTVDVTLEDGKSVASQQVYVVKIGNTWYVDNTNVDTSALYLAK